MQLDNYIQTIKYLKAEILHSRYNIAKVANKEILFLYYKIGNVISKRVANEKWEPFFQINTLSNQISPALSGQSKNKKEKYAYHCVFWQF